MSVQIKIPRGYSAAIAIRPYQDWRGMRLRLDIATEDPIKDDYDDDDIIDDDFDTDVDQVPDFEESLTCPNCQGCAVLCNC